MDVIKTEPDIDPLGPQNDNRSEEERKPLFLDGNFLEVDVDEIKDEPYDLSYDHISDMKFEEMEDPISSPVLKFEVEGESCNMAEFKPETLSDFPKEDDDLTVRCELK
ncbi:uncharacterized protein [Periplaneta americana]|uniref:uncharacterized protein isoform X2 n=1 Tax=Periplaneta americana TaxID=6978 RepID=UPI0037E8C5B3